MIVEVAINVPIRKCFDYYWPEDLELFPEAGLQVLVPFGSNNHESVVLRPVSSLEAMTARFYPLPDEVLKAIITRIEALNKISYIFYDVTNKPPATIEWE